jgi:hypothetical protein
MEPAPTVAAAVEVTDVNKSFFQAMLRRSWIYGLIIVLVVLCGFVAHHFNYDQVTLLIGFAGVVYMVYDASVVKKKLEKEFIQEFGTSIGLTYDDESPIQSSDGTLYRLGMSTGLNMRSPESLNRLINVLTGVQNGQDTRILTYDFKVITKVQQMNSQTHQLERHERVQNYAYTVIEYTFNAESPQLIVASKKIHTPQPTGPVKISFEGDFDKHFAVTVSKGFETEAYQILTPDVLEKLLAIVTPVSFEFYRNHLYVYTNHLITKRTQLEAMLSVMNTLATKIQPTLERMKGNVQALEEYYKP